MRASPSARAAQPTTYVALLRGINVGGNAMVGMTDLKKCFEALRLERVRTYINSGNVIFRTASVRPRALETKIERALTETFGRKIRVVVRSYDEMKALIERMPRSWQNAADERRNVIFLRHTIDNRAALDGLVAKPGIEQLEYHPGVLFWTSKTSDLTRSNMLKVSRLPIYKEMTVRNVNTTRKIFQLMREAEAAK
jgi:uncharacterized protein (DUF1697 family)